MNRLTPLDIAHAEFSRAAGGYNRGEVRAFLERISVEVEELKREVQALTRQLDEQGEEVQALKVAEDDLRSAVVAAERIAADVRRGAEREAELILGEAERQRKQLLTNATDALRRAKAEFTRLETERALFKEQFRGLLTAYLRSLDAAPGASKGHGQAPARPTRRAAPEAPAPAAGTVKEAPSAGAPREDALDVLLDDSVDT